MDSSPRGYLLIINNGTFNGVMTDRHGTDVDCKLLQDVFMKLGFGVDVRTNLTAAVSMDNLYTACQFIFIVSLFHEFLIAKVLACYKITIIRLQAHGGLTVNNFWLVVLSLTGLSDIISVHIRPSPREREKKEK